MLGRHALRNAFIPIVTLVGLQSGQLMGGAVLTETVFAWPGLGRLMVKAIFARDYILLQGAVLRLRAGLRDRQPAGRSLLRPARPARGRARAEPPGLIPRDAPWTPGPASAATAWRWSGSSLVVVLALSAALAPWLAPYDPARQSLIEKRAQPGAKYVLGADEFGRDILSRVIYGSRVALLVGVLSVTIAVVGGLRAGHDGRVQRRLARRR